MTGIGVDVFTKTVWQKTQQEENQLVTVNGILINGQAASGETVIPDDVTSINSGAFRGNVNLTSITISGSVTVIGYQAFYGCDNLTIKGYAGSAAKTHAAENNIPFEGIDGEEPEASVCEGLKYMPAEDAVIITGFPDDLPEVLEIPAEIDGLPVGDSYAIDFARLLINYDDWIFTGTFSGKTEPSATVRLLGTSTTVTASSKSKFSFSAIPGINAVRASKNGFVENYDSGIVLSSGTEWKPEVPLEEGEVSPDIDFSKFAETGLPIKGDYDGDGKLAVDDAVLLMRFVAEDTALTAEQVAQILNHEPDFDEDGLVTLTDVRALLKVLGKG